MSHTQKQMSEKDDSQTLKASYNEVDASLTINTFLVGVVGRKIDKSIVTTTIVNDSEIYAFSENGSALYSLKVVYTDGTRADFLSAERIS